MSDIAGGWSRLEARNLTLAYDDRIVATGLSTTISLGGITTLVGPNGSGKSTLLRAWARLLKPRVGAVYLDDVSISALRTKMVARQLGILPQGPTAPEGMLVRDLVAKGRYPHQSMLKQWSAADEAAVERALVLTSTDEVADRPVDELSGGQSQRVWIAMALAQETPILLLDEPTTYLDVAYELEILQLLHRLNRQEGRSIVMVLHDLNLAACYSDRIIAMKDGRIVRSGKPGEVVCKSTLREVFGVEADIVDDPVNGTPYFIARRLIGDRTIQMDAPAALDARGRHESQQAGDAWEPEAIASAGRESAETNER